ncbi:hypothetical protein [Shewanella surugensis]|uniref:Uncharacterized protein n=1 Tax=Shewanella surugensis TaxID=212020 RepID=A0ABT0LAL3_9GAMM|nr:hypothetical protein [Shewanella surugensis]MCL1124206.1 hypothetical protein [Shewanella surugensis]
MSTQNATCISMLHQTHSNAPAIHYCNCMIASLKQTQRDYPNESHCFQRLIQQWRAMRRGLRKQKSHIGSAKV